MKLSILSLKPLMTLFVSYVVCRALLFIGLLSGLFFSLCRYLVGLHLLRKYKHPIVFVQSLDAKFCIKDETLQSCHTFKGRCDIDELRRRIDERWLQPRHIDGRWKHLKLRQQIKLELGYYFWTPIPKFRIENHVVLHEETENLTGNDDLHAFIAKYSTRPAKNETHWQLTLVNSSNNHIIVFRVHHALMDEISMNRMLKELFDDREDLQSAPTRTNFGLSNVISFWSRFFASAPYQFCQELFSREENHSLRGQHLTGTELIGVSAPIGLERFQQIMKQTDSAANDIIMSCVVGALRAYFVSEDEPIPTAMRLHIPVWLHASQSQDDDVKLENNATMQSVLACIDEPAVENRLMKCKTYRESQTAPVLYFTYLYFKFYMNRFPLCATREIVKRFSPSAVVSCLATTTPKRLLGNEPAGQQICLPGVSECGLAVTVSLDVNRSFVCAIRADLGIIKSQERINKLVALIEKEFNELCNVYGNMNG